ncbi:bifunctional chorismate mutase/prephenate dehydratase [Eubacterium coprostanoligenes]|uniref:bifunctional chorismate mutase/prephenate dehydratase n=1 Tax=Eubacterium coprostanoligenes TaxID=290054 RepID=UPI002357199C|nr:bifunctional chorismate mutase/prephenate dehydratase [Eubacterium coprostanoligenes]MCI6254368.1 chorismate mutase [Eubacterium coprostanoligenes]MCI6354891.1 chorismate mutase [Eubacterium coprostanoligenes]MDD7358483.1 prephenate dehydratase domain-containing protein [Eubacterium coprostanoligenes]MDY5400535.1 prephenate dehydratase domain-containing protein [Eubacterium coprostanoligenes]
MDLLELRNEIDKLDDELIPLLLKRMDISRQVAEYKVQNGIPVLNEQRELEILEDVASKCGEQGEVIKTVFSAIMDASRALQHKIIGGGVELRNLISNAKCEKNLTANGEPIACQGVQGAYSGEAAKALFPDSPIDFHKQFEDVFEAVNQNKARFGIIPVENSTAGSVHESYDLIMKYKFFIVGAYDLRVDHCLCAKPGVKFEDIENVYSHTQALSQCNIFLKNFDFTGITFSNTAAAAKFVSESEKNNIAAICSESAAKKYGLKIIRKGIQNVTNNTTRFIVISKELVIDEDAEKISLIFSAPHRTGSLYRVLGRFSMTGLNLTKLESRPVANGRFDYYFYVDILGSVRDEQTLDLLCALSDELPEFSFLGNYYEGK